MEVSLANGGSSNTLYHNNIGAVAYIEGEMQGVLSRKRTRSLARKHTRKVHHLSVDPGCIGADRAVRLGQLQFHKDDVRYERNVSLLIGH